MMRFFTQIMENFYTSHIAYPYKEKLTSTYASFQQLLSIAKIEKMKKSKKTFSQSNVDLLKALQSHF